ncbi:MAG: hypothetical protein ACM3TR_13400 [Caulobacteraceae bacterium]
MKKYKVISVILVLVLVLSLAAYASAPAQPKTVKVYEGMGQLTNFRVGPGKDSENVQVYSFTTLTANATFDKDGRILNVYFDAIEVSTPNYDGASMPHFSGWPGTQGYNVTDHKTEKVSGISFNTNESIAAEVNAWQTKRERGDNYGMNPKNDWYKQVNFYQNFFKGKTIDEIEAWVEKNTDANHRPLKVTSTKPEDQAKYAKLTDAEKKVLADVVSGATMSISDAHGDFIGALKKAYANRVEVTIPAE